MNCGAAWVVQGLTDPRVQKNPRMKQRLVGLLEEQLTCAHQRDCPWRVQPCPSELVKIQFKGFCVRLVLEAKT